MEHPLTMFTMSFANARPEFDKWDLAIGLGAPEDSEIFHHYLKVAEDVIEILLKLGHLEVIQHNLQLRAATPVRRYQGAFR